jgi:hypothetical protein
MERRPDLLGKPSLVGQHRLGAENELPTMQLGVAHPTRRAVGSYLSER